MSKNERHFKLWAAITSEKNIEALKKYPYFFANSDHILVFSERKPKNTAPVTSEFFPLFEKEDWEWIERVSEEIRRAEMGNTQEDRQRLEEFLKQYEQLLKEAEEAGNAERNHDSGGDAESSRQ